MNLFARIITKLKQFFTLVPQETCCERLQVDCRQGRDCPYRNYGANSLPTSEMPMSIRRKK